MSLMSDTATPRFGIKGRSAPSWLLAQGLVLPQLPNTWLAIDGNSRVLRLGRGEYLVEGAAASQLDTAWLPDLPDLYRVPRYDAGFVLKGQQVSVVLAEICALDTRPEVMKDQVLMTLAAGISVILVCETGSDPLYRLWCDATYGEYMQSTLNDIIDNPLKELP